MQLRHSSTLMQPAEGSSPWKAKVTAICFAPDNSRMAVVTTDRIVSIYDENGERVDKFSTKPNDKGPKNYLVRAMNFCPDPAQPKLAVAQSDNIVFVYKWTGAPDSIWEGKKSICNKFAGTSPVTSLVWPVNHPFEVVYGLAEGKVRPDPTRPARTPTQHTHTHAHTARAY